MVPQFGMVPAVLDMFALPFDAPPFALAMAWHPRNHDEPGLAWLRELAATAASFA